MNSDFLMKAPRFPKPGETLTGTAFLSAAGGKGANQAVAAARLGARVALISCIGADERGRSLLRQVQAEGVNTRFVRQSKKGQTGAALILIEPSGEKQILATAGANEFISSKQIQDAGQWISSAKVLLLQFEAPIPTVLTAARLARKAGVLVVLDPAPPVRPPPVFYSLVDAIRPNSHEAQVLTGVRVRDRRSALRAAKKLAERGIRIVSVQAGDDGNLMLWDGQELWLPKISVTSVDATGAGDAFAAALAVALVEKMPPARAGWLCSAAAALTTTQLGAQPALPTRRQVNALVRKLL
jgi:ribokinase